MNTTRRSASVALAATLLAGLASACLFPADRTTDGIVHLGRETTTELGATVTVDHYRNEAYRCGRSGHFTFSVIEPLDAPDTPAPLWIFLRGGGVGYYGPDGVYRGTESLNDEEPGASLVARVRSQAVAANGSLRDTVVARRLLEGYRILVPSMCDHDLHAGFGTRGYPNNPHGGGDDPDTVDGLAANLAAFDHVTDRAATSHVVVHGVSAGSVGAWALAYALHREGVDLAGAVLDSYLLTERLLPLFDAGVTPQQSLDADFDPGEVEAKIGPFVERPAFHLDRQVASGFDAVPTYSIVRELDPYCAGHLPPLAAAVEAGVSNNCAFVYGALSAAVAGQTDGPHRVDIVPGAGHVVTQDPGPWTDAIDGWLAELAG